MQHVGAAASLLSCLIGSDKERLGLTTMPASGGLEAHGQHGDDNICQ